MMVHSVYPYPPQGNSLSDTLSADLEHAVEYALERRWFEAFDVHAARFKPVNLGDLQAESRFFSILELAHGEDVERSLHLLNVQNVLSSFRDGSHSITFALRSAGQGVRMHMGARRFKSVYQEEQVQTADYVEVLRRTLRSNLPGIVLSADLDHPTCVHEILDPIAYSSYLGCVTGIPSLKQDATNSFVQGLDRLVDAMRGEEYTLLVIAEPILEAAILTAVHSCRQLSEEIHALVRQTITGGKSRTEGASTTYTEGTSQGVGTGSLLGILFNFSLGRSIQTSVAQQESVMDSLSGTREALNKTAEYCESMLDHYLARLQNGRNLGFWNVGLYVASEDPNTFLRLQGIVRGLFSGRDTHFEPLRVVNLRHAHPEVKRELRHLRNPVLEALRGQLHPLGEPFQQLSTPLTTDELSLLVALPRREVPGVRLTPMADFGLNPPPATGVSLGRVLYRGEELENELVIPLKKLTQHAFVTGITGAGKTNTCLVLLKNAYKQGVPFLVIEPAKMEYRSLLEDPDIGPVLWLFTLGYEGEDSSPFRLNPFEFTPGFPLLTHIDLLKAVFNAAFPMYAPMPFILEEALLEVYTERGWDIVSSHNRYLAASPFLDRTGFLPRLTDLYNKIEEVVARKQYAERLTMDITAALKARIQSLRHGGKGLMLDTHDSIPFAELLRRPTVLELRRIGDDDEKAFLMALLLMRLYEEREVGGAADGLVHLTLIEEAHRLLRHVPSAMSMESANARGKAVEMFTDILAEVREYGEGLVIVDQVPSKLAPDVVKNTNLKVLHRLVAQDDRDFVGNAMNLTAFQKEHVVRLRPGQAIVHSESLDTPILTQIHPMKVGLKQRQRARDEADVTLATRLSHLRARFPALSLSGAKQRDSYFAPGSLKVLELHFQRLLTAIHLSPPAVTHSTWRSLSAALNQIAVRPDGLISPTDVSHLLLQLSEVALRDRYAYYEASGADPGGLIAVRQALFRTLQALEQDADRQTLTAAIADYRQVWRTSLAERPREMKPGCALCNRPCSYGYDVQWRLQDQQKAFAATLRTIPPEVRTDDILLDYTCSHAVQSVDVPIDTSELPHFAYCWLANVTTDTKKMELLHRVQMLAILGGPLSRL